jgi:hypothetical protein
MRASVLLTFLLGNASAQEVESTDESNKKIPEVVKKDAADLHEAFHYDDDEDGMNFLVVKTIL